MSENDDPSSGAIRKYDIDNQAGTPGWRKMGWQGPEGGAKYSRSCIGIVFEEIPNLQQKDQ